MLKGPIRIKKVREQAVIPTYGTEYSAGADIYSCIPEPIHLAPGKTVLIPTGIAMEIPTGYVGLVYARSSLAVKRGLTPANKVSVIDSDYRGELMVPILNHSGTEQVIEPAERIAQMIFTPYYMACFEETDTLEDTNRGAGGFGSTGKF
ncbi:MAG: dUTP diphosphatase [Lachnospiraceae bacterium]|nr:dUTP diphosphatase [Lachnospiraceae bacterium]